MFRSENQNLIAQALNVTDINSENAITIDSNYYYQQNTSQITLPATQGTQVLFNKKNSIHSHNEFILSPNAIPAFNAGSFFPNVVFSQIPFKLNQQGKMIVNFKIYYLKIK